MGNGLTLDNGLVHANKRLHKPAVLRIRVMECVNHIRLAEIWLDGRIGWRHVQIDHDAVYIVDYAIDETGVPDSSLAHFDGERRNLVVDKRRFDGAGLSNVDFQRVGLQELGQALDVGKSEVGVAP